MNKPLEDPQDGARRPTGGDGARAVAAIAREWAEEDRLSALRSYTILDSPPEQAFDDFVRLAAVVCAAPMALVSFVDAERQWFKARVGLDLRETPIEAAFCSQTMMETGSFVVRDTLADPRFAENRLVVEAPFIRFYASSALVTEAGLPIGTLCVLDTVPRPGGLSPAQASALEALARQVMVQIDMRRALADRATAEGALMVAHRRTRDILESIDDPFYVIDRNYVVTFGNAGFCRPIGLPEEQVIGRHLLSLFPDIEDLRHTPGVQAVVGVMESRASARVEIYSQALAGWCEMAIYPMSDGGVAVYIKGIDARKRMERDLAAANAAMGKALAEKELLMLEVHHRVKNSLQMVQSLLTLQARNVDDAAVARQLQESAARVRTFGALHETLYEVADGAQVDIRSYLEKLVLDLSGGMATTMADRPIRLLADTLVWPASDVSTLGLVLTELVTNALKYGAGLVTVRFEAEPGDAGGARLVVEDEGTGLAPEFEPTTTRGLGMRLVTRLLRERDSRLEIDRSVSHTRFVVHLPQPVFGRPVGER